MKTALKQSRLDKWGKMISYGLDEDLKTRVIQKKSRISGEPITFTKYAKVGLTNFIEANSKLFFSRLQKGPPPAYRWLAWKIVASRKLKKTPGLYNQLLLDSNDSPWLHDIMKDLNRTFPMNPLFDRSKYGETG